MFTGMAKLQKLIQNFNADGNKVIIITNMLTDGQSDRWINRQSNQKGMLQN